MVDIMNTETEINDVVEMCLLHWRNTQFNALSVNMSLCFINF